MSRILATFEKARPTWFAKIKRGSKKKNEIKKAEPKRAVSHGERARCATLNLDALKSKPEVLLSARGVWFTACPSNLRPSARRGIYG